MTLFSQKISLLLSAGDVTFVNLGSNLLFDWLLPNDQNMEILAKIGNEVPGPGTYTVPDRDHSPNTKFSTSMRFIKSYYEKEHLEKPGPGSYDTKEKFNPKFPISKAKRIIHNIKDTPGPGRYQAS